MKLCKFTALKLGKPAAALARHLPIATSVLLLACGIEVGNPKKPGTSPTPTSSFLIDDAVVASTMVSSQADHTIEMATTDLRVIQAGVASPSLGLTGNLLPDPGATSSCATLQTGGVLVARGKEGPYQHDFHRDGVAESYADSERQTREQESWSQDGQVLKCNSQLTDIAIDWNKATGLKSTRVYHSRRISDMVRGGNDGPFKRHAQITESGEQDSHWDTDTAGPASSINLLQTLTESSDITVGGHDRQSRTLSLPTHTEVAATAPIIIAVRRDKTTQAWQTKTILSGTMVSTTPQDSRIESTYNSVVFTSSSGCVPTSGAIAGKMFHDGETSPFREFTITFAASGGTIAYSDGAQEVYMPDYCLLDDLAASSLSIKP